MITTDIKMAPNGSMDHQDLTLKAIEAVMMAVMFEKISFKWSSAGAAVFK